MPDWFETRFRDGVDPDTVDPMFAAHVRRVVVEEWKEASATTAGAPGVTTGAVVGPHITTDDFQGETIVLDVHDTDDEDESVAIVQKPPRRWLVAAAVLVAILVGAANLGRGGDDGAPMDTATPPTETTETTTTTIDPATPRDVLALAGEDGDFVAIDRGSYFVDPDGDDATPLRVIFDVDADGWESWSGAVKRSESSYILLTITTIDNVVRHGCEDHSLVDPPIGPTVDDLVAALSTLAPFELSEPPTPVTILDRAGTHLQLTTPDLPVTGSGDDRLFSECAGDSLHSWLAPNLGDTTFYGYNGESGRTEDFWIVDVDGTRLVLITSASPAAPAEDLRELDAMFDSIRVEA